MRQRTGAAFVIALLVACQPTIVSLCELRCVVAEVAGSETNSPACHGRKNAGEAVPQAPSGGHQDCSGHVLLAKGGASGIALRLDRAIAATVLASGPSVVTSGPQLESSRLEFTDLSPPFARSSDILRL